MAAKPNISISEVSRIIEITPHTIRYWEQEFHDFLRPQRGKGLHRKYGSFEIDLLKRIKKMLKEEKYSIAGARQKLFSLLTRENPEIDSELLAKVLNLLNKNTATLQTP